MQCTYIIWKHERHGSISDHAEVVGIFTGTYEEADAQLARLNAADPSVMPTWGGRCLYGYYRTEPTVLTSRVIDEIIDSVKGS